MTVAEKISKLVESEIRTSTALHLAEKRPNTHCKRPGKRWTCSELLLDQIFGQQLPQRRRVFCLSNHRTRICVQWCPNTTFTSIDKLEMNLARAIA
jgi:hypothetical protein